MFDCERFFIGCIYRPPYNDIEYMSDIISTADKLCTKFPKQNLVLFGDFNLPNIDWSIPKPLINDKLTKLFIDCILLNGFEQIVDVATRGSNILDLVLCRNLNMVPEVHIKHPLVDSDHETIEFTLSYTNFKSNMHDNNTIKYKRNFQKINVEGILNYFKNINWFYEFSMVKNVEERYAIFLKYLNLSIQMFVPLKLINRKTKKFYLPKHIKLLLLKKRKLWRIMKAKNTPKNKLNYTNNKHVCKEALKKFHVNKMKAICNSKNIKQFYNYVNRKLGRSKSSIILKDKNGTVLKNIISVEMFAKYFQSVFSVDDGTLPNMNTKIKSCLNDIIFDEHDINTRLQALPIKYSCGPDEIPTAFLKILHNVLALPLSLIFQDSLNSGILPYVWKCANIVPVY